MKNQSLKRWGEEGRGETETRIAVAHMEPLTALKRYLEGHFKIISFSSLRQRSTGMLGEGLLLPLV